MARAKAVPSCPFPLAPAHVLATPGMDSHGAYVSLSRHRDGVQLHYGRDDFKDESRLVRTLSRERAKDMASDYERRDPAQQFAERRGITFRERVVEIIQKLPERARGMFDGFRPKAQAPERGQGMLANFRPQPHGPERGQEQARPGHARAPDPRRAVERYARAAADIERMQGQGLPVLAHQREALDKARAGVKAIRPHAGADLASAIQRQSGLVHEAAQGRTQSAMRAMQLEAEIRSDPFQRADRFAQGWQQLQQHCNELQRDGDLRGMRKVRPKGWRRGWMPPHKPRGASITISSPMPAGGSIRARRICSGWLQRRAPHMTSAAVYGREQQADCWRASSCGRSFPAWWRARCPEAWDRLNSAGEMWRNNRKAIDTCERDASKTKQPVRCTIRIRTRNGIGG